jgi:uncharacterized protein
MSSLLLPGSRLAPLDGAVPIARLTYNGVPLWDAISSQVISLTWTDNIEGEADEIELTVENSSGRWFEEWSPQHGDRVEGAVGYLGDELVDIGTFFVDSPSASGGRQGDTFSTRGQSVPPSKGLRTKKTKAHEKQKLGDIAKKVASEHGMVVVGTPPEVAFERITQRRETDLAFLKRLAEDYGAFFAVKGNQVVFTPRADVFGRPTIRTLRKGEREIISYQLSYEGAKTVSKAKASYYDGNKKKNIEVEVEDKAVRNGNTLRTDDRVEDEGQAKKLAKSKLDKANMKQWKGSLTIVGDPTLVAGQTIALEGYGRWDRTYSIVKNRSQLTRSGLTSALEINGVREQGQ